MRQHIKNQTRFLKCQNRILKKEDMRMQFIFMFYQRKTEIKYNRLNPIAKLISKELAPVYQMYCVYRLQENHL